MNRKLNSIYLVLTVIVSVSCVESKTIDREANKSEGVSSKTDTLKFTSGIRAIFQDSKGNYWFGSLEEGAAVYKDSSFVYFTDQEGLAGNQIHSIQEDKDGIIWLNTQLGVSSFDGTRIKNHAQTGISKLPNNFFTQSNEPLPGQWMKSDGDLWFDAGIKEGAYRYDGQKIVYLAFPPHKVLNHSDNLFAVTSISKGRKNMIWLGTYAGVFGYNGREFTIINDETLGFDRAIAPLHIRSILEDTKGRLWMGNNGIGVLLKEGNSIINFSEERNLIHPASSRKGAQSPPGTLEHVFTIAEDSQGNIWFGDRDAGVWKYDGKKMENYTVKDGLTNDFALSIYKDHQGALWFGMKDGSVYQFNGKAFERRF